MRVCLCWSRLASPVESPWLLHLPRKSARVFSQQAVFMSCSEDAFSLARALYCDCYRRAGDHSNCYHENLGFQTFCVSTHPYFKRLPRTNPQARFGGPRNLKPAIAGTIILQEPHGNHRSYFPASGLPRFSK